MLPAIVLKNNICSLFIHMWMIQVWLLPFHTHFPLLAVPDLPPDGDITPGPTNITLDPMSLNGSVQFIANADGLYELTEEVFILRIVGVEGGEIDPERAEVAITIIDIDGVCQSRNVTSVP